MPYIKRKDYERARRKPAVPGELNYAITHTAILVLQGHITRHQFGPVVDELVLDYLYRIGMSYTNANAVMGVLNCAARELKRRVTKNLSTDVFYLSGCLDDIRDLLYSERIAPYEDTKIAENGDVFPAELLDDGS